MPLSVFEYLMYRQFSGSYKKTTKHEFMQYFFPTSCFNLWLTETGERYHSDVQAVHLFQQSIGVMDICQVRPRGHIFSHMVLPDECGHFRQAFGTIVFPFHSKSWRKEICLRYSLLTGVQTYEDHFQELGMDPLELAPHLLGGRSPRIPLMSV